MRTKEHQAFPWLPLSILGIGFGVGLLVGKLLARKHEESIENVGPDPNGGTVLFLTDSGGVKASKLGYVISCPQSCSVIRPGGTVHPSKIYPTPGSMREIVFLKSTSQPTAADVDAIGDWLGGSQMADRVSNDVGVDGCAHVSKLVPVTQLVPTGSTWTESVYGSNNIDQFYSLVAYGQWDNDDQQYIASEIWISNQEWNPDANVTIRNIYADIRNRPTPDFDACR